MRELLKPKFCVVDTSSKCFINSDNVISCNIECGMAKKCCYECLLDKSAIRTCQSHKLSAKDTMFYFIAWKAKNSK